MMTPDELKRRIEGIFQQLFAADDDDAFDLVPDSLTSGKVYEAFVLADVARHLVHQEGFELVLVNGNHISLKSAPGPINRSYPVVELRRNGTCVAEIWTDVEFLALSYSTRGSGAPPEKGEYHELDIMITDPGLEDRPPHDAVWLGVECKNTGYGKGLLKEILGVRRELSYLQDLRSTRFGSWPRTKVKANPPSCLMVYSTDEGVRAYSKPGELFGIDFKHLPLAFS